jgi:DUF1680 family protein
MKAYKVQNRIAATPLSNVRLYGYVAELMARFFDNRIFSDEAHEVIYRECEEAFVKQVDDTLQAPLGYWQGEFWGKWIISAARVARYEKIDSLICFIRNAGLRLAGLQREDGYLGTYRESQNFMAPKPEDTKRMPCWNWNIWCRKYTLWGMLEAYLLTEETQLLRCAVRMADHLIGELAQSGRHIGETGTFCGMPSCSIMKPMLILYRLTEDSRYLDFCLSIADRWEDASIMPGLIANALSGKPLTRWYPESNVWAKAYEMMSCFDGLIELYRVTGNERYLRATEAFFDILMEHERNALYSVAFNDVFGDAAYDVACITEPCDIIHLMRLCHELFLLTGKMKYMDAFEEAFYNPFLAGVFSDGKWGARGVRGIGRHLVAFKQAFFTQNHCCVNNLPRGFMNMAESCVMHDEGAVYILLYTPSDSVLSIDGHTVRVHIDGDYLADSRAKITVDFGNSPIRTVHLRIPAWTSTATVSVGGNEYSPTAGYFTVTAGENRTEISVAFDECVKPLCVVCDPERGNQPWKAERFEERYSQMGSVEPEFYLTEPRILLRKGVILLCRSKLIGSTEEEMFGGDGLLSQDVNCTAERIRSSEADVNLEYNLHLAGGRVLHVCDFASGTNRAFEDDRSFSIYF